MPTKSVQYPSLPGPHDITRTELPNGIIVLSRSNFNSPSVVISGYLSAGSLFDPLDKLGLAYFTALMLTRGTQKQSFQEIFGALESAGASLGFGASVHNASFGGKALVEDLPMLLATLSDVLRNPIFPIDHIEKVRMQSIAGLQMRAQDTGDQSSMAFDAALFPDHPYGRPEDGHLETIQAITREDLVGFHQRQFGPRGMVIVVVGAVSAEQVVDEVQASLGDWRNPSQIEAPALPVVTPPVQPYRQHITIAGKSQTDLVMGTLGPERGSPDYLAASLGNNILGQFGMMGRIGDVVREQAGLAYYASTSLNSWITSGSWEVSAGVNPANLQYAIDLIRKELHRFASEPVTADELSDSQANFIGRLPLSLESNHGVANALLNLERFQLGIDYYQRYPEMVKKVTTGAILQIARSYLDTENLIVASAGPELVS
ncbi:MAG: insulinase family protein [Methanothrix sp.]|nr:insulinase family protein [Methanothrix sp.]